jgi:hypothetical protein
MARRFLFSVALFGFCTALPALAAAATVGQILSSPSSYDGRQVAVSGTVEQLERKVSRRGNPYVTFSICSGQCIHVFAFGSPSINDGQTITVRGTFAAVKHVSGYTFFSEIDADDGSL